MQETLTERSLGRRQAGEVSMSGQEGRGGEPAGVSKSHLDERRRGGQPRRQSARALARGGGQPPVDAPPPSRRVGGLPGFGPGISFR
jgi:hypothetical protein